MRVKSSLADIDFEVGRLEVRDRGLVVHSGANSSVPTKIYVTPADAKRTIGTCLKSWAFWRLMLRAPFARSAAEGAPSTADGDWSKRRTGTGINKPW